MFRSRWSDGALALRNNSNNDGDVGNYGWSFLIASLESTRRSGSSSSGDYETSSGASKGTPGDVRCAPEILGGQK